MKRDHTHMKIFGTILCGSLLLGMTFSEVDAQATPGQFFFADPA